MRLAYARIMQESNAFSPVPTTLADFEGTHLVTGDALAQRTSSRVAAEVPGFARNAELSGLHDALRTARLPIEAVPIMSAWAISGGPLTAECASTLETRLVEGLKQAGPVDGVFLALHGAMSAQGEPDIEARILESVRSVVGKNVPIACTFDLHGLLTQRKMANVDLLAAYHTNPHRDHRATGARAGRMLIDAMRGRPAARAWRSIPMVMGGGAGVDFLPPSAGLFRLMREIERDRHIHDVSLFLCHPWNDHAELGWSVAAFANTQDHAERAADRLAAAAWEVRDVPPPRFLGVDEALARIRGAGLRRKLGTVCVCDASDVVGAGGSGENTHLLAALLAAPDLQSFVPLRDSVAVAELWDRAPGATVTITVGGRHDPADSPPISVRGVVRRRRRADPFGRTIHLDLGHVQLVLTEGPPLVMKPSFYRQLGLEPLKADITVVKSFFPFRIFFLGENRLSLYVKTRGVTDLDRAPQVANAR